MKKEITSSGRVLCRLTLAAAVAILHGACIDIETDERRGQAGVEPMSLGTNERGLARSAAPAMLAAQKAGTDLQRALATEGRAQVVVALRSPVSADAARVARRGRLAALRREILANIPASEFSADRQWELVPGMSGVVTAAGLDALVRHPAVLRVDLDRMAKGTLTESAPLVRAGEVHALGVEGAGVKVAIVDSGVAASHPDLAGRVVDEHCSCSYLDEPLPFGCCPGGGTEQDGPGSARDDNGHGTHIAGIIASQGTIVPRGIAPGAELVAVRSLDASNTGAFSGVLSGLDWLLLHHADVRAVNISVGGNAFEGDCATIDSTAMNFAAAIDMLRAGGTVVVIASGNDGHTDRISFPGCLTAGLTVGAVYDANVVGDWEPLCTDRTTAADQVTCFSNSGALLDLLAPGAVITSANSSGGTLAMSGTSMAAPHVAAAVALLASHQPDLSAAQIEQQLIDTGVPVTDARNGRVTPRIDMLAALSDAPLPPDPGADAGPTPNADAGPVPTPPDADAGPGPTPPSADAGPMPNPGDGNDPSSEDDAGCGCNAASRGSASGTALLAFVALIALARRRRPRRPAALLGPALPTRA